MCLAIPMKVKRVEGGAGVVEYKGVEKRVSTLLVEDLKEGDYILVHAGFAIAKVGREEAEEVISLLEDYLNGVEV